MGPSIKDVQAKGGGRGQPNMDISGQGEGGGSQIVLDVQTLSIIVFIFFVNFHESFKLISFLEGILKSHLF